MFETLERKLQTLAELLGEAQAMTCDRMAKGQAPGMKKHVLEADLLGEKLVGLEVPVALVSSDRYAVPRRLQLRSPRRG